MEDLKQFLANNILSKNGKLRYSVLKTLPSDVINQIHELTKFLDNTTPLIERIYYILCEIQYIILCPSCKIKKPNFISLKSGYHETCSVKCSTKFSADKVTLTKIKNNSYEKASVANRKTKLEKYGDENYNNRDKCKKTCMEKYGVENPMKADKVKEKIKETNLEKYGVENPFQSEIIKDKIKETSLSKYGVENYSQASIDTSNGYRWKEYKLPSGKIIKFQGYEDKLLDELLEDYDEDEILISRKDMPEFWYKDAGGKKHRYFPDIYIPKTNTIYEVKSEYTLNINLEINELKFQSVIDSGYNFNLKIY